MFAKKGPKIIHEKDTFCQARGQWRSRDRIVVSTLRCGRSNPGSNPGHGTMEERKPFLSFSLKITQPLHASSEFDPENLKQIPFLVTTIHQLPSIMSPAYSIRSPSDPMPLLKVGLVVQWITRLTTDQKILGSTPG